MSVNVDDVIPLSALQGLPAPGSSSVDDVIPPSAFSGALPSTTRKPRSSFERSMDMESNAFPVGAALVSAGSKALTDIGATGAVLKGLFSGNVKSLSDAARISEDYEAAHPSYTPPANSGADIVNKITGSPYNPINYPGELINKGGELVSAGLDKAGAPSYISTAAGPIAAGATGVGLAALGAAKGVELGETAPEAAAAARKGSPAAGATPPPGFDTAPVEGGVPDAAQDARAALLQRVGLDKARPSAISGNAKDAATDWQLAKLDEPAGVAAKAQFDAERTALQQHAQGIVKDTGGTLGTDEDTLNDRGRTIAAPFDALRDWYTGQKKAAYDTAADRAQGQPIGEMTSTEALLKDPNFTETLLAKDQGGLLDSINRQYNRFKGLNPGGISKDADSGAMIGDQGMTVENAENLRKWVNQIWTPENSKTLGQVKGAIDDDVFRGAGEDIYGPARAMAQTEYQTLDNPKGVSRIMDFDPQNPLNRTTPYAKIPDTIARLDPDQFQNIIKTLDVMPDELQPLAQAAKSEIKAHLANKLLDAGSTSQGQWNAGGVGKVLKANSAKFQAAFADDPETLQKIQDLDSAGRILKTDQSYPGAAAQAANLARRGGLGQLVGKAAGTVGATVGGTAGALVAGPVGAAAGGALGTAGAELVGTSLSRQLGEGAAEKRWTEGLVPLNDLLGTKNRRTPRNNP